MDRFVFRDGHFVIVLASGRLLNLGCGPGHPSFEMPCPFTVQVLTQLDLLRNFDDDQGLQVDSSSCRRSSMSKVANCTFQHSVRSSLRTLRRSSSSAASAHFADRVAPNSWTSQADPLRDGMSLVGLASLRRYGRRPDQPSSSSLARRVCVQSTPWYAVHGYGLSSSTWQSTF